MSLISIANELEFVPQNQLVEFMNNPNSRYPQYLVLSEIQRRTRLQKMYENQTAKMNRPQSTVAEEAVMEFANQGAVSSMPGISSIPSPDAGLSNMAPPSPMQMMANGGLTSLPGTNIGTLDDFRRRMIEEYMAANVGATTQEAIAYANQNAETIYNERLRESQSIERQPLNLQSFDPDQIASNVLAGAEASAERRKELALDGFMGDRLKREGIDISDLSLGDVISEYDKLYRKDNPIQGALMNLRDSSFGQGLLDLTVGEDRKFDIGDAAKLALGGAGIKAASRYGPSIFQAVRNRLGLGSATPALPAPATVPAVVSRGLGTSMVPYVARPPAVVPPAGPSMFSRFTTPIINFVKNRPFTTTGIGLLAAPPIYNFFNPEDEPEKFDMSTLYSDIDFEDLTKNRQTKTAPSGAERVAALNLPKVEIEPFTEEDRQRELDVYALGALAEAIGGSKNFGEAGVKLGTAARGLPAVREQQRKRSLEAASAQRAQAIEEFKLANDLERIDIARVQAENTGNRVLAGELASVRAEIAAILKDSVGVLSTAQQARLSQLIQEAEILTMDLYGKLGMEYVPPGGDIITNQK